MRKFSRLCALSWPELRVLTTAAVVLPLVGFGLRALGLVRLRKWLQAWSPPLQGPHRLPPATLASLIGAAANHLPVSSTCLTRSLLLDWFLHRQGTASELRIGVRIVDARLDAHAWVECGGKPVNDSEDVSARYSPFEGSLSPASFARQ